MAATPVKPAKKERSVPTRTGRSAGTPNLNHPTYYINRELSWLEFNRRVLQEALDKKNPLLERVKFLSIFHSNLDEFFMIRVSGLKRQLEAGALKAPPDGLTPAKQLAEIRERLVPMLSKLDSCWKDELQPELYQKGIRVVSYDNLKAKQRKLLRRHFRSEILPILTPLAFDPGHPFPHISNLSINLAVMVNDPGFGPRFARLKVPHTLPRLMRVPIEEKAETQERLGLGELESSEFVWLEEVVSANLDLLFPGLEVTAAYPFRVTRNADVEIEEDEAADLLAAMKEVVGQRYFGFVIRLEIDDRIPKELREILVSNLDLAPYQVYPVSSSVGLADLMQLMSLDRPDLKDEPFQPVVPSALAQEESVFSILKKRDLLFYHPYDSFTPMVEFVRSAATDPQVVAIKITLYRVGPNSPIVEALKEARENGKQVSALVELKARFDEENNIEWARALERAGVHVVYGLLGLKTHAKMCLVVRRERKGIVRYVHLGTGNYNPVTARIYTDIGFMTTDSDIAADVTDLFNALTGYSRQQTYKKLLVSPVAMKDQLLKRIRREIEWQEQRGSGYLAFKLNSLQDKTIVKALYKASQAGVCVDLQVRGICCLRPGLPRVSENITVTSVVGRFLEHTRIFYFRNGGDEEILLGSADLMPRNLKGRVETLFPVEDPHLLKSLRDDVLGLHMKDNVKSWRLQSDGTYKRIVPEKEDPEINSQLIRLNEVGSWHLED
jgi:polyphosphate kinase